MTWSHYEPGVAFRAANEAVLGQVVARRESRLLGEIEGVRGVTEADQEWLARDWIPRLADAGVRWVALVTPAFDLEHAPLRLVGERVSDRLHIEYFGDAAGARAWLAER